MEKGIIKMGLPNKYPKYLRDKLLTSPFVGHKDDGAQPMSTEINKRGGLSLYISEKDTFWNSHKNNTVRISQWTWLMGTIVHLIY